MRAHNRGLLLVEKTGFKQIQGIGLLFRNLCHSTHFRFQSCQSDCNLHNQIAISTIGLQSPQSECRDHATSPSTPGTDNCICKLRNFFQSAISAIKLQSQQSDCNLSNQTAISTIRQQSLQLDCYLHKQTVISTIRLQSAQSMIRFYHVFPIGVQLPECGKHLPHCYMLNM